MIPSDIWPSLSVLDVYIGPQDAASMTYAWAVTGRRPTIVILGSARCLDVLEGKSTVDVELFPQRRESAINTRQVISVRMHDGEDHLRITITARAS